MVTYEQFLERSRSVHGYNYEYEADTYVNTHTKMWMTHTLCGHRFQQLPKNHLRGQGCPECGKKYAATWGKQNWRDFVKTASERFGDRYSFPHIKQEYENSHSKVTVHCNRCGHEYTKIACDFVSSKTGGCWCTENEQKRLERQAKKKQRPKKIIVNSRKLTVDEVKKRMSEMWPSITPDYSTYVNTGTKFHCKCLKCGHEFDRKPNAFFNGSLHGDPCPECNKKLVHDNKTKTTDDFKLDAERVHGEGSYTVLGEYTASNEKIHVRCNDCGRDFFIEVNSFLQGHGCPYHNCNSSGKEKEISEFVGTLCDGVKTNDRTVLGGKELDIYVPSKNIAIEFDGVFWHNENNKTNDYHLQKTVKCAVKGVRLIHIFEDEWRDKRPIWESMLKNIFGQTGRRIYARKCVVETVSARDAVDFLNGNHIQGWCPGQIKIGLRYDGELVSLMTFGKSRHFVGNGASDYELLRFCNKLNTTVVGGASRLFEHFVREYNPETIISFADRRWSVGNLYDRLGFIFSHYSKPNYFYVIKDKRYNRFNFRKSVLVKKYGCADDMSEREFCKQQHWYRIYDCGTLVYWWFKKV